MDRDVQLRGILVEFLVRSGKNGIPTEKIDRHSLDRADIHERMTSIWVCQVRTRQHLRIELFFLVEVARLKPLAVDLVNLVKLQSRFWLEGRKGQHGLCRECPTIYKKQNALRHSRFHEPIDFVDHSEGLTSPGRHSHQHLPLLIGDGLLDGRVRVTLVGAQSWMIIRGLQERLTRSVGVSLEALDQGFGSVELSDDVRPTEFVSDVVMPDDFAIR